MTDSRSLLKTKICWKCQQPSQLLYRIQSEGSGSWVFVCPGCWLTCSKDNPHYRYGGTWKQRKK